MKAAYKESPDALNIRIRAHAQFSSLKIESILESALRKSPPGRILDVGCGSGNYSELLASHSTLYVVMGL